MQAATPTGNAETAGCSFVMAEASGDGGQARFCNAPRQPGSAYCAVHHARCHLAEGSAAARRRIREIEALARAVGGRQGDAAREPPRQFLTHLDRVARAAARPNRSRFDPKEELANAGPPAERGRHGPVERVARPIPDAAGQLSRPYRAVDTLAIMERRGSITAGMRQAGEDFRARFTVAQLDPLRALDLSHLRLGDAGPRPDRDGPGLRIEAARRAVWQAIQSVGGIASPAGSCLWHVLGWECSLKEWAIERGWSGRQVSQEAASGILVAALGALETHFSASR